MRRAIAAILALCLMPDSIGRISVPTISPSGSFGLVTQYPHGMSRDYRVVVHQMDNTAANLKIEQRFLVGTGARKFTWRRDDLNYTEVENLKTFYDDHKGPHIPFTYNAPDESDSQVTTAYTVVFANEPLSIQQVGAGRFSAQCTLIEIPSDGSAPTYSLSLTTLRFPAAALASALLAQSQELIPLVHITVTESGHPDNIFLSDRRCTIGSQLYLARLLQWSEISQTISTEGASDIARFTFGNADRVMRDLAADTNLRFADVEFSLFHVGQTTKLDIWKGKILRCSGHNKDEFEIEVSDSLDLGVYYPIPEIQRSCWKVYNDGLNCVPPGTLDAGFPSASLGSCDKTYDGDNGCRAHDNERQFGGHLVKSEIVHIKDNSTGTWGWGRRQITPSSLVADTAFGEVLPEYHTNVPMLVNGRVMSGRDESGFFIALIIVGSGPLSISRNAMDHRLDGQSAHGPGVLGLRISDGPDPANQSSGIFPSDNDHYFQLDESTWPPASPVFAAGTAFLTIRRVDEEGIQVRPINEHQAQVKLSGGLDVWRWTDESTRLTATASVNPIWIAIDKLIRVKQLRNAATGVQTPYFDVDAAIDAADICDTSVTKLVGSGSETQYRWIGGLTEKRPLRDWLQDILNSCLGYYTFIFGKLRIGVRVNSSVVEAFTAGNIIHESLEIEEVEPEFNTLTVEYNDEEHEFAKNTVYVELEDHVKLFGRRHKSIILPGVVGRSQALRLGATRVREECGGKDATDWKKARRGSFKTTVLGIGTEPGMVCSLTHDEMPGGAGEFRLLRWTLYPDMSLRLDWRTTTDAMYDLTIGPKPADVLPDPLPVERIEEAVPIQPWFPNRETPDAADPIFDETDKGFFVQQIYEEAGDGTALAKAIVKGDHPVTEVVDCDPPRIGSISTATTGGSIPNDSYVTVILVATNTVGQPTRGSRAFSVLVGASGNAHKITLTDITWPAECSGGGYRIYAGVDRGKMSEQASGATQPSSLDLTSIANVRTRGFPQENLAGMILQAKIAYHVGINGLEITSVGTGTLTFSGAGWTPNEYNGRVVAVFADKSDGSAPFWHFTIDSHTSDTLTLTPDPEAAGVEAGDVASIMTLATSFSATTIGDSAFQNPQYPGGLNTDEEKGRVVEIISGTGKGQERLIVSNTATVLTITPAWSVEPDATSIFIVKDASWQYESPVNTFALQLDNEFQMEMPLNNLTGVTLLVEIATVDRYGRVSKHSFNPWRMIYIFGDLASIIRTVIRTDIDIAVPAIDAIIEIDTSGGNRIIDAPAAAAMIGKQQTYKRITGGANTCTVNLGSDTVDGASSVSLPNQWDSFTMAGAKA